LSIALLQHLALRDVRIDDAFWAPRIRAALAVTLPEQYVALERTGRIDNFRRAAGKKSGDFQGRFYNDSDVYKWLEAASYALAVHRDARLQAQVDAVIGEIAAAQGSDGYLNTYFTFARARERWTNLAQMHELYCAGHLIQAAVAHEQATGTTRFMDVARRFADYMCATFGPSQRRGTDGHEEIELALVELYRATGQHGYLAQARFFLDQRGQKPPVLNGSVYLQDHLPVREQSEIAGHAVRATYLACGMVDVALETGEEALWTAAERLWTSAFERKQYVTGGLGARFEGEAFGADYELPNDRAYAETCAAIGAVMWNRRMLSRTGDARYADAMERSLYNGALAGLSLRGGEYFYVNPLESRGAHQRQPWFETACCPPNIARLLFSLQRYAYSVSDAGLWIHLYVAGSARVNLPGGDLRVRVETAYPWSGTVQFVVQEAPEVATSLLLRVPEWCAGASVRVGDERPRDATPGHVELRRVWRHGEEVTLDLPLPVRRIASHPRITSNTGRVALARGPLIYCLEAADHPAIDVFDIALPSTAQLRAKAAPEMLGGVVVLHGEALLTPPVAEGEPLYRLSEPNESRSPSRMPITAIPYYAWANREPGPMQVWLREG
jgi:DUF1680 family protein